MSHLSSTSQYAMDLSHLEETPLDVWCKLIDIQFLSIICQRYCRGILPHSPVCVYWSTRNSANGVRCSNNCETSVASTDQQTKYYAVSDSFSELHCAKPYSAVQLKTVYSDFCRDGYLANTFELQVITKPSLISTLEQDRNNDIHCVHPAISEVSHATAKMSTCAMPLVQCSTHSDEVFTLQYADDSCTPVSSRQYCREVSPSIQSRYSSMATDRSKDRLQLSSMRAPANLLSKAPPPYTTLISENKITMSQCYWYRICVSVIGIVSTTTETRISNFHEQSKIFDPGILSA